MQKETDPISHEEEELLWLKGFLGADSPKSPVDTTFYINCLYFGLCEGKEQASASVFLDPTLKLVVHHANIENPGRCFIHLHNTRAFALLTAQMMRIIFSQPL